MVNSTIALTVSIDETFISIVVVLDTASSRTFEHYPGLSFYSFKFAIINVFSLYLEALRLYFIGKLTEIVSMILLALISAYKIDGTFFSVLRNTTLNEDILEYALRRDGHYGDIS